jgi:hypothetical protein
VPRPTISSTEQPTSTLVAITQSFRFAPQLLLGAALLEHPLEVTRWKVWAPFSVPPTAPPDAAPPMRGTGPTAPLRSGP